MSKWVPDYVAFEPLETPFADFIFAQHIRTLRNNINAAFMIPKEYLVGDYIVIAPTNKWEHRNWFLRMLGAIWLWHQVNNVLPYHPEYRDTRRITSIETTAQIQIDMLKKELTK